MKDLIDRQAAIDAIMGEPTDAHYPSWYAERLEQLPSAQQERIIYGNMSDEEFEKWLYGHGICSPNIHESIPCDVVPLLIDNAISELPSAQPEQRWIPCSERLPKDKTYVLTTIKIPNRIAHVRSGWYEGGFIHNDNGDVWKATDMEVIAWMPLPDPYKTESEG